MYKKVTGRRRKSTRKSQRHYDNPLPKKSEALGNDIRLIRPKSRFNTARAALADILDKHDFNKSHLEAKHTKKAWRWVHK